MEPSKALVAPVLRRVIVWDDAGVPQLATEPVLDKTQIRKAYFLIAAQPYICDDPLDPDFAKYDGMTIAEVLIRKQLDGAARSGDINAIETVMDRLIDKPLARGENLTVSTTYESYLKGLREKLVSEAEVVAEENPFGDLA